MFLLAEGAFLWAAPPTLFRQISSYAIKRMAASSESSFGSQLASQTFRTVQEYHQVLSREMLSHAMPQLVPTPIEQISLEGWGPSTEQQTQAYQTYLNSLQSVRTLAHDVFPFIYYQSTPEHYNLHPQEINQITQDIGAVYSSLQTARGFLAKPDPALNEGMRYLNRLQEYFRVISSDVILPFEADEKLPQRIERPDRVFRSYEFLLKTPFIPKDHAQAKWYHRFVPSTSFAETQPLPQHLRVAIINDNEKVLLAAAQITKHSPCAQWQIDTYTDPEDFLVEATRVPYDLVLTDLMVAPGGGTLLAAQLRARLFKGTILAVTGGGLVTPVLMHTLYNSGMDGVIPIPEAYYGLDFSDKLVFRLRIYFYYKEQGKWNH